MRCVSYGKGDYEFRVILHHIFIMLLLLLFMSDSTSRVLGLTFEERSKIREDAWEKYPFLLLRSAASPAWLLRARSDRLLLFYNVSQLSGMGGPTYIFFVTQRGVQLTKRNEVINGLTLIRPWVLVTFTNAEGWNFDIPWLVYMQKRPAYVKLAGGVLR